MQIYTTAVLRGVSVAVIILGILMTQGVSAVQAETFHSGTMITDEIWRIENSPHIILHDFVVDENASLTILPGARVEIGDADAQSFFIKGTLIAEGTEDAPIRITSYGNDVTNWTLALTSTSAISLLKHIDISNTYGGIILENTEANFKSLRFNTVSNPITVYNSKLSLADVEIRTPTYSSLKVQSNSKVSAESVVSEAPLYGPTVSVEDNSELHISRSELHSQESETLMTSNDSNVTVSMSQLLGSENLGEGISSFRSTIALSSTTLANFSLGIYARETDVSGSGVQFASSTRALYVAPTKKLPPGGVEASLVGDMEVVSDVSPNNSANKNIAVTHSSFEDIEEYFIQNLSSSTVEARHNWWGSNMSPHTKIEGSVNFDPWVLEGQDDLPQIPEEEAPQPPVTSICCSNVLFIPGFEASRLYIDTITGTGISTNQLWDPNRNDDIRKLFMTSSTSKDVYTKDVIDSVLGYSVYSSFIKTLNDITSKKYINAWKPFPYDWRYDISTIAQNGATTSEGIKKLSNEIASLASTSLTGKVTIVAHSNGGLISKYLVNVLKEKGMQTLLDTMILVGVPELGTPKAVAALLHGYDQEIAKGLVMKKSVAREFGKNMPGVYGLLPGKEFFSALTSPVVAIASTVPASSNLYKNSHQIISYDSFVNFLTGRDGRQTPNDSDVVSPSIAPASLVEKSTQLHSVIDTMSLPSSLKIMRIIGTGLPTVASISYSGVADCPLATSLLSKVCELTRKLAVSVGLIPEGDGTVLTKSAKGNDTHKPDSTYFVDLNKLSKEKGEKVSHATLLASGKIQDLIKQAITATTSLNHLSVDGQIISSHEPTYSPADILTVAVHSPADIHVYDELGRHTGIIDSSTSELSDFIRYEDNVPESVYINPGEEGQFIQIPYGKQYTVVVRGNGVGTFSVTAERKIGDTVISSAQFSDMPITPETTATFITATSSNVSSPVAGHLKVDVTSDGKIDVQVPSSPEVDVTSYLLLLKAYLPTSGMPKSVQLQLEKRITKILNLPEKDKNKIAKRFTLRILKNIMFNRGKHMKMQESDRKFFNEMLQSAVLQVELSNN